MKIPFELITGFGPENLLDEIAKERLSLYAEILVEWNQKMNLTAITESNDIAVKHFLDCAMLFKYHTIEQNASLIDVGTGAGFPGLVLKILRPDLKLTLLDSLNKRITFLQEVAKELSLDDVVTVHSRAEDGAKTALRESFDYATARAVAPMQALCEFCLPYVKVGGYFIAMKGASAKTELDASKNAMKLLGAKLSDFNEFCLNDAGSRGIIVAKKISQTPSKYPRNPSKIKEFPL